MGPSGPPGLPGPPGPAGKVTIVSPSLWINTALPIILYFVTWEHFTKREFHCSVARLHKNCFVAIIPYQNHSEPAHVFCCLCNRNRMALRWPSFKDHLDLPGLQVQRCVTAITLSPLPFHPWEEELHRWNWYGKRRQRGVAQVMSLPLSAGPIYSEYMEASCNIPACLFS